MWLVVAVDFDMIVAGEVATILARVVEWQALFPFSHSLAEYEHPIVCAIEEEFAQTPFGYEVEIGPRQFKRQQVAYHALVGIGCQHCPVVVFSHAQEFGLEFLASLLKGLVDEFERIGFLVGEVE
jgi:hypothetical protein